MLYDLPIDPKTLREYMCSAQGIVNRSQYDAGGKARISDVLQQIIAECDRHRPLGPNGKHGSLHTETCGCEDKGPVETWGAIKHLVHGELSTSRKAWCGVSTTSFAQNYKDITCGSCITEIDQNI
jgi:hypothetical protein